MTEEQLKPCPFCGGTELWLSEIDGITCQSCHAQVLGAGISPDRATWNRRSAREAEAAVKPLLAELRDKLASLPEHDRGFSWESRDYRGNPAIRAYGDLANALYWVTQNSHAIADALVSPAPHVAEGWQPMETAPRGRWLLLDMSYLYPSDTHITEIYTVGCWTDKHEDYCWDCGEDVHHRDAPKGWMDIPKTKLANPPGEQP